MNKCLIACPIFAKELEVVLSELSEKPTVHLMDYTIHISEQVMEEELSKSIQAAQNNDAGIILLVGQDCKAKQPIVNIAEKCGGVLPQEQNCIEMLLGPEKTKELQQNRTCIMTTAWYDMIKSSIAQGLWTVEDARINLGWYDQIILLDTGVEPLDEMMIMDFFELIQVPIDTLKISLSHFKQVVAKLIDEG